MSKKTRRRTGGARSSPAKDASGQPPGHRPRLPVAWLAGIAAAVLASALYGVITWVGPEVVDGAATKDKIRQAVRSDDDLRYTVQHLDPAYDLILPSGVELTSNQKAFLENWTINDHELGGYDLNRLIAELRSVGGANPEEMLLRITLEGRRNQSIHVDDIRPVNIRRSAPYSGTFLNIPPQAPGETVKVMFNFDEIQPRARVAVDDGSGMHWTPGGLFFQEKTLTVTDTDEDAILVKSITTRSAVTFEIRIDYRIGGKRGHLIVNDRGRPFALTAMSCIDRTQPAKGDTPAKFGHATYEHVWQLRGDFQGIEPSDNPRRFETGYC